MEDRITPIKRSFEILNVNCDANILDKYLAYIKYKVSSTYRIRRKRPRF